jgi:hypothetical protein
MAPTVVVLGLLCTSCSPLRIEPTDHPGGKVAKVAARIPLSVATFGMSEVAFEQLRLNEETASTLEPSERVQARKTEPVHARKTERTRTRNTERPQEAAEPHVIETEQETEFRELMDGLVGILTYDEALLRLGPPASIAQGDQVIVAEWGKEDAGLRLSFSRRSRRLVDWQVQSR